MMCIVKNEIAFLTAVKVLTKNSSQKMKRPDDGLHYAETSSLIELHCGVVYYGIFLNEY
jgi:hypothetical protein